MGSSDRRESPRPGAKSRTVARQLRAQLERGTWPNGSRLPPDHELARIHSVSLNTIRRALAELVRDGLIVRLQGSGSFVNLPERSGPQAKRIGLCVPTSRDPFPALIEGVEEIARRSGVQVALACTGEHPENELQQIDQFAKSGIVGLIAIPSLHRCADPFSYQRSLASLPIPVVLAERLPTTEFRHQLSFAKTDVVHGMYSAVAHLAQTGRRRIGLLSTRESGTASEVYAGYLNAIRDFDLPMSPNAVVRRLLWADRDLRDFAMVVESEALDGLVCLGDVFATRLLTHLFRRHIRTPDDVAIVAYEDRIAAFAQTPLTAIRPQRREVGRKAAQILLQLLDSPIESAVVQVNIQPRLIIRASSAALSRP